jgi:large subunit ribosomal protein L30
MDKKLKIKLVRSFIGRPETQRRTAHALSLRKLGNEVIMDDSPSIRGMVAKIQHLVTVEEIDA